MKNTFLTQRQYDKIKVRRTIHSCRNNDQLDAASNMVVIYCLKYGNADRAELINEIDLQRINIKLSKHLYA